MKLVRTVFVIFFCCLLCRSAALVERVGSTAFIQLDARSFADLDLRQQSFVYWLTQAAIAIDPILYDQVSRFGLRQKRVLEAVFVHKQQVDPYIYRRIADFAKLFWGNKGNHNKQTGQKLMPSFTAEELKFALGEAGRRDLIPEADSLRQSFFDAKYEPVITAKNPEDGKDILEASSNNFYSGVKLSDLANFTERYRLNSRVAKVNGRIVEQVYRAGTPDGRVPPGMYAEYLRKANEFLDKARAYATPAQAKAIQDLIRYYQTGEYADWIKFDKDWVQANAPVDFANGFIENYRDARGAKATSQGFVCITDEKLSSTMLKIAANAQYFENHEPWLPRYKKQAPKPPIAKAVEVIVETGDFPVTAIGDNLPNENEIREKFGSKSFLITGNSRAMADAMGFAALEEFALSPEEIARAKKYGQQAEDLRTAMHEVIGHGSGKVNPKLTRDAAYYLKGYAETLEECRADLVALWNMFDPKLKQLGLVSSDEVGKAAYDLAARLMVTQLAHIPKGDTIEEDHERARQLTARYVMETTGAISIENRNGKTYIKVTDYAKMRHGVGTLLSELMRIKAEGDYSAGKALIDRYAVRLDTRLRDQVVMRYHKLNLPTDWTGINPDLIPEFDSAGKISKVTITYPRNYAEQQLAYSAMYNSVPLSATGLHGSDIRAHAAPSTVSSTQRLVAVALPIVR
jgi:dipeptidyl-peptidase-3